MGSHPELHAAIHAAAINLPPGTAAAVKAGLLEILAACGPEAVAVFVATLEKIHPEWTLGLEAVKLAVTRYLAGLAGAGA